MVARTRLIGVIALVLLVSACAHVKLVADRDEKTLEETIRVAKRVDVFYGTLLELQPEKRQYAPFARDYVDIGADIGSLVQRNAARPLNEESTQVTRDILSFWRSYQEKHRNRDEYPDARFDRRRFERLFRAAVSIESAKSLPAGDTTAPAANDD